MSKLVLGYWAIRGLAEPIRLLLRYLGVDFEDKLYQFGPAPEFSGETWFSEKFDHGLDFPNVPYLKDGDFKLSESKAILKYIASAYGKNMVPEGVKEQAIAEMVLGHTTDIERTLVNLAYGIESPFDKPIEEATAKPLELLASFLGSKKFILGDSISYVDFYVYDVLKQYIQFRADFLRAQPLLEAYVDRFEQLPQLKEYIASTERLVCYSPYAKLQF